MTTFEDAHARPRGGYASPAAVAGRTVRALARIAAGIRRRREVIRSERQLQGMPDHMLKDIGMHRSEIPALVRFGRAGYGA